jgi:hypothetical protein
MSKLFNYAAIKDTYNKDGMLPGQQGVISGNDQIAVGVALDSDYIENGQVVVLSPYVDAAGIAGKNAPAFISVAAAVSGSVIPDGSGNYKFYGVVLADIHAAISFNAGVPQFIYKYKGQPISVLRTGYVWVPVNVTTPATELALGAQAYVKIASGGTYQYCPLGAVTGADTTSGTPDVVHSTAWTGATFTGRYGFPLSGTGNATTSSVLTGLCALVKLDGNVLA